MKMAISDGNHHLLVVEADTGGFYTSFKIAVFRAKVTSFESDKNVMILVL